MKTIGIFGIPDHSTGSSPRFTHDHCLTVMEKGKVLVSIELERITGVKHDNRLPLKLCGILERLGIDDEVRYVSANSFIGSSFCTSDGRFRIEPIQKMQLSEILTEADVIVANESGVDHGDGHIICHEFAHIASVLPFVGEFLPNSLLVHIDGGASESACSFWHYDGESIRLLHHSWDDLKTEVNNFNVGSLGLSILGKRPDEHLSLPGKLMGYAALGNSDETMMAWLQENGWFFSTPSTSILQNINNRFASEYITFDQQCNIFKDIARCVQDHFSDSIIRAIVAWRERTGAVNLYYSGGAALNIITNRSLELSGGFDKVFIPPCPSDCGLSLGASSWLEYLEHGRLDIHDPFLNNLDCDSFISNLHLDEVKRLLLDRKVLGVRNGASEVGPRALGHRSIICLANDRKLSQKVSMDIKHREWYRPLAPMMCESAAKEVLEEGAVDSELSRYMLGTYRIRDEWCDELKGIIHGNCGLRAQTVYERDHSNSWMHSLLKELWEEHSIPGLVNTSFNVRGSPIIHTKNDALVALNEMGLDGVVIDGSLHIR